MLWPVALCHMTSPVSLGTTMVLWLGRKRRLHRGCNVAGVDVSAVTRFALLTPITSSARRRTMTSIQRSRALWRTEGDVGMVAERDRTEGLTAGAEGGAATWLCPGLASNTGTKPPRGKVMRTGSFAPSPLK